MIEYQKNQKKEKNTQGTGIEVNYLRVFKISGRRKRRGEKKGKKKEGEKKSFHSKIESFF